ncbi:hypothetical protein, partial [Stenotrophomonas maltophilia]|uniref:hypothetical protein n=1 Tax=Stenotrophomonas maltophilia TaxID=40324 RepID=UPI001E303B55
GRQAGSEGCSTFRTVRDIGVEPEILVQEFIPNEQPTALHGLEDIADIKCTQIDVRMWVEHYSLLAVWNEECPVHISRRSHQLANIFRRTTGCHSYTDLVVAVYDMLIRENQGEVPFPFRHINFD